MNLLNLGAGPVKDTCSLDTKTKELASFGPYTTKHIDIEQYCPGAAHPSDINKFRTMDASSGEQVKLTDLFKKEDIYNALMQNDSLQKALSKENEQPKNFDELEKLLSKPNTPGLLLDAKSLQFPEIPQMKGYLDEKALSNFALDSVTADHFGDAAVDVKLLLDYEGEAARNSLPTIDIWLPINEDKLLRKEIMDAAMQKDGGFLMKDSQYLGSSNSSHKEIPNPFQFEK
jgi:hypothetical protein